MARLLITATTGVAAVTASFVFLVGLARAVGWPGRSALLLPLSVDALAAAAWLAYWSATDPVARRFAGRVGAGATAASLVGNGLSHLLATGAVRPTAGLIAVVGGVPAVSLALVVRLMVPSLVPLSTVKGDAKPDENYAPDVAAVPSVTQVTHNSPITDTSIQTTRERTHNRKEPSHGHVRQRPEVPATQEDPRIGLQGMGGSERQESQERGQVGEEEQQEEVAPTGRTVRPSADTLLAALPDGTPNSATAIRAALAGRGHRIGPTRAAQLRDLRVNGSPGEGTP